MDFAISLRRQMEPAMACRRVSHDALGIDGRSVRGSPWPVGAGVDLATSESCALLLVEGVLLDMRAKRRLVGKLTGMAVEIAPRPFGHGPADTPARDKIVPAIAGWSHGECRFPDKRNAKPIGASAKRNSWKTGGFDVMGFGSSSSHAAVLPSTVSAATVSAVTCCNTAFG